MPLKVLLVDPDEEWLEQASEFLKQESYDVKAVVNGKDAQVALYNEKFFSVLLNYSTKNHSGVQVLKFIKTNYTGQRVIMIINSQEMIDSGEVDEEKLIKMGATECVVRPFEHSKLCEVLEGHQSLGELVSSLDKREGVSNEEEVSGDDEQYTAVKINEFYSSKAVLFDVYIRLGSGRYIKILHAGDSFSKDRIDKYQKEKGIEHLYFHIKDRRKFIQYNNFLAGKLVNHKQVATQQKVSLLKNISEKFIEDTYAHGMKPQIIQQGKEICENIYTLVDKDKDLYKLLKTYQDFDPNAFTHCYLVTLFSSSIIKQFEWQSKATIENTALACMFHDIGKMQLDKEMIELRPKDMSEEQLAKYKQHPELGIKMVEGNQMINNSVKQIILQHHECFDGTGFPRGIKGTKILTLANIVGLADSFVHRMIEEEIKPVEALKVMLGDPYETKKYNSMIIENFIKVFVDPEKVKKEVALPSNSKMVPNKKAS